MKAHFKKFYVAIFAVICIFAYNNCSSGGFETIKTLSSSNVTRALASNPLPIVGNEPNVIPISVGCGYINEPCVSVTICSPTTKECQTIPNVLLDTGSYGLRIFSTLVTVPLTATTVNGGALAECVGYADGSSNWGPVKVADVILGQERASNIPIQLIDAGFASLPSDCTKPDIDPNKAGFNGILGVGIFTEDCGSGCATIANNRLYFSCTGTTCTPSTAAVSQQVSNPVSFFPTHNNGVVLQFPSVPESGAATVNGYMVLGIGTHKNNTPVSAQFLRTDSQGLITTNYNGKGYRSYIDSGSNGLFFPGGDIPDCSRAIGFYCPSPHINLLAIQQGKQGTAQLGIDFQLINAEAALAANNPNMAFANLGGESGDFAWGLPFFFGRTIYNGIEGKSSPLGTGPYWAY